jgi:recombinational DNA repair ATPase RecF
LKRGNWISIEVQWENQENSIWSPEFTFSQWQLSWVALSCVLAFYKKILLQKIKLRVLLIDDPIQTIDDLNSLNLINILRYDFDESQVILSTHEDSFDRLIRYKYQVLWKQQKNINMRNL